MEKEIKEEESSYTNSLSFFPILSFPETLIVTIFSNLSEPHLKNVRLVCKRFRSLILQSYLFHGRQNISKVIFLQTYWRWKRLYFTLLSDSLHRFNLIMEEVYFTFHYHYKAKKEMMELKKALLEEPNLIVSEGKNPQFEKMAKGFEVKESNNNNKLKKFWTKLQKKNETSSYQLSKENLELLIPDYCFKPYLKLFENILESLKVVLDNYEIVTDWKSSRKIFTKISDTSKSNTKDLNVTPNMETNDKNLSHNQKSKVKSLRNPTHLDELVQAWAAYNSSFHDFGQYFNVWKELKVFLLDYMNLVILFGNHYNTIPTKILLEEFIINSPRIIPGFHFTQILNLKAF